MPSTSASGTATLTSSTDTVLASPTTAGNYALLLNLSAMGGGQELEVRIKTKVLTGGTLTLAYYAFYANAQAEPIKISIPVPSMFQFEASIKKTAGGDLAVPWSVLLL